MLSSEHEETEENEPVSYSGINWLFTEPPKQVLCPHCFYFGRTRAGLICNYFGTYNPHEVECRGFKTDTK